MKKDIIHAASREDAAEALKAYMVLYPLRHIQGMIAFDNKDGSVEIHIVYIEEHQENGHE